MRRTNTGLVVATGGGGSTVTLPWINVKDFGALGNNSHDDTAAFTAAIATAVSGSVVFAPLGTYLVSQVTIPAGVTLQGVGPLGTILSATGTSATTLDGSNCIVYIATNDVTVSDLTIYGRGSVGTTVNEILLGLLNAARVTISNIIVDHAAGRGIFAMGNTTATDGCVDGVWRDVIVKNTYGRISAPLYGVPFWAYVGFRRNRIDNFLVDTSPQPGFAFDSGSSTGPHATCDSNTVTNLTVRHAGGGLLGSGAIVKNACSIKGGSYNVFQDWRVEKCDDLETNAWAISDAQQGEICTYNLWQDGIADEIGGYLFNIGSASHNTFREVAAYNIAKLWYGAIAVLGYSYGFGDAGSYDNLFDGVRLRRMDSTTYYPYGVLFAVTSSNQYLNRFKNCDFMTPTTAIVGTDGGGNSAPLVGANANLIGDANDINFVIDGAGSAITTGVKGDVVIDYKALIVKATLLADQSGSIVVNIWKQVYGSYPATVT